MSRARTRRRSLTRATARLIGWAAVGGAAYLWWERNQGGPPLDSQSLRYPEGADLVVITPDGAELAICDVGPADAPTVVLPHCWMGSRAVWGPVAQRLMDAGLRVVLYDQRGHGASTAGERAPSIAVLGDDLRAVLEAVDASDVVLGGHSMGGMTIQAYAAQHPVDFKERVRAMVLVSTTTKVDGPTPSPRAVERMMGERATSLLWRGAVGYALVRRSLGRAPRRADVELTLAGIRNTPAAIRMGFMTAFAELDFRSVLPSIEVPATVLVGERDALTPPSGARVIADALPSATLTVMSDAGHMLPLERPDEVAAAIRDARLAAVE